MSILNKIIDEDASINTGFTRHYLTLFAIIRGMEAKNVLEIGGGLSTIVILEALKRTQGNLTTCDPRDIEKMNIPSATKEENPNWNFIQDISDNALPKLQGQFDVVLHDGSQEGKVLFRDLRKLFPKIKSGGVLLVHDTNHPKLKNIYLATRLALLGRRYQKITLPYGNGLTIIVKK